MQKIYEIATETSPISSHPLVPSINSIHQYDISVMSVNLSCDIILTKAHKKSDTTSLSLSLFTFMPWRRKWQPTPVFLPGESQGQRSLVGCCLWGRTELDTTEVT